MTESGQRPRRGLAIVLAAMAALGGWWLGRQEAGPPAAASPAPSEASAPRVPAAAPRAPVPGQPMPAPPSAPPPAREAAVPATAPTAPVLTATDAAVLSERSRSGDGDATFELAGKIDRCSNIDRLLADAERIAHFKQMTHVSVSVGANDTSGAPSLDEMAGKALDRLDAVREECRSLGETGRMTAAEMLQKAIDQGSAQAKLCYLVQPDRYAPSPLTDAWHAWYARYRQQAPTLVEDLVEAGIADGVLAAGVAYAGVPNMDGSVSYLRYALDEDLPRAATYLLWQQRFAPGTRTQAFGRLIADLQGRLGPAFAAAAAQAGSAPPLNWLPFVGQPADNCTLKIYTRAMEMQALSSF